MNHVIGARKILDNGPDNEKLVIAILAEGFTVGQQTDFNDLCDRIIALMRMEPWFDTLINAINIYRINVESNESGADDPVCADGEGTGAIRDTYFDATFCGYGEIRRLLIVDNGRAWRVSEDYLPQGASADEIVVLVNTPIFGGSGGTNVDGVAVVSVDPGNPYQPFNTFMHEIGHSIFGLGDEYPYYQGCEIDDPNYYNAPAGVEPGWPNVTQQTNRLNLKWANFVDSEIPIPTMENQFCAQCDERANVLDDDLRIGLFEGADHYHCGRYRPAYSDKMRNSALSFCRVCTEAIFETLRGFFGTTPTLAAAVRELDFGTFEQGLTRARTFEISNAGQVDVTGISFSVDNAYYSVGTSSGSTTLAAGESLFVVVRLGPVSITGPQNGRLDITSNSATLRINLTGNICTPTIPTFQVVTESGDNNMDFGEVVQGDIATRSFEVRNVHWVCPGTVDVGLDPITDPFRYAAGTELTFTLPPPDTDEDFTAREIFVSFNAPVSGGPEFTGVLTINTPEVVYQPQRILNLTAISVPPRVEPYVCYAPTFRGQSLWGCIYLRFIYSAQIAILAIFALFSEEVRCYLKQLIFRVRHCREGNERPDIEL